VIEFKKGKTFMKKRFLLAVSLATCFLSVQLGFVRHGDAQWSSNSARDLFGENMGDSITIQWTTQEGAAQYFVYQSTSSAGPWTVSFSVSDMRGGAKVIYTPDARLMDLCYKVEATDATGAVIKVYEPICVPKYAG